MRQKIITHNKFYYFISYSTLYLFKFFVTFFLLNSIKIYFVILYPNLPHTHLNLPQHFFLFDVIKN